MNEDPSPQRPQRRDKRQASSDIVRGKLGRVGGTIQRVHRHERSEASDGIGGDLIEEEKRVGGSRAHIGTTRDDEKLQLRSRYENIPQAARRCSAKYVAVHPRLKARNR
ncbi:hypothetical protein HanRHA438_Chr17g0838351 [Helianthus annuus]|nr:hypothetical protein HanRHA438_Chr17g0838351 [Helianthus annuus]